MPTGNELAALYDTGKIYMSNCGNPVYLTALIHLTCSSTGLQRHVIPTPPPSISTLANFIGLHSPKLSTTGRFPCVPANSLFGHFLLAGGEGFFIQYDTE